MRFRGPEGLRDTYGEGHPVGVDCGNPHGVTRSHLITSDPDPSPREFLRQVEYLAPRRQTGEIRETVGCDKKTRGIVVARMEAGRPRFSASGCEAGELREGLQLRFERVYRVK
jgi:hypothetical protein